CSSPSATLPRRSPLFPYTTLFRSVGGLALGEAERRGIGIGGGRGAAQQAEEAQRHGQGQGDAEAAVRSYHDGKRPSQGRTDMSRSEEHTSELQSRENLVCRLLLEK